MNDILELSAIWKSYKGPRGGTLVLQNTSLRLSEGELVALLGASGTGKSTLLHIAGLLDEPDKGVVSIAGHPYTTEATDLERTRVRARYIGFVYQFHHLMPELTALENVALPQRIVGTSLNTARRHAQELLERLGLGHRLHHKPSALSGGEQQRVAVARALANTPALLLADEPTGNLDEGTAEKLITDLIQLARATKISALIATHNPDFAVRLDRQVHLKNGTLFENV